MLRFEIVRTVRVRYKKRAIDRHVRRGSRARVRVRSLTQFNSVKMKRWVSIQTGRGAVLSCLVYTGERVDEQSRKILEACPDVDSKAELSEFHHRSSADPIITPIMTRFKVS